jgi:hypothetical protein
MCFKVLAESQKVQVNMFIKHQAVPEGTVLWNETKQPSFCFFVYKGTFTFITPMEYKRSYPKLKPGYMVGDFPNLMGEAECRTEMRATSADCEILMIKKEDMLIFLGKNPGLMLVFKDEFIVI